MTKSEATNSESEFAVDIVEKMKSLFGYRSDMELAKSIGTAPSSLYRYKLKKTESLTDMMLLKLLDRVEALERSQERPEDNQDESFEVVVRFDPTSRSASLCRLVEMDQAK